MEVCHQTSAVSEKALQRLHIRRVGCLLEKADEPAPTANDSVLCDSIENAEKCWLLLCGAHCIGHILEPDYKDEINRER